MSQRVAVLGAAGFAWHEDCCQQDVSRYDGKKAEHNCRAPGDGETMLEVSFSRGYIGRLLVRRAMREPVQEHIVEQWGRRGVQMCGRARRRMGKKSHGHEHEQMTPIM